MYDSDEYEDEMERSSCDISDEEDFEDLKVENVSWGSDAEIHAEEETPQDHDNNVKQMMKNDSDETPFKNVEANRKKKDGGGMDTRAFALYPTEEQMKELHAADVKKAKERGWKCAKCSTTTPPFWKADDGKRYCDYCEPEKEAQQKSNSRLRADARKEKTDVTFDKAWSCEQINEIAKTETPNGRQNAKDVQLWWFKEGIHDSTSKPTSNDKLQNAKNDDQQNVGKVLTSEAFPVRPVAKQRKLRLLQEFKDVVKNDVPSSSTPKSTFPETCCNKCLTTVSSLWKLNENGEPICDQCAANNGLISAFNVFEAADCKIENKMAKVCSKCSKRVATKHDNKILFCQKCWKKRSPPSPQRFKDAEERKIETAAKVLEAISIVTETEKEEEDQESKLSVVTGPSHNIPPTPGSLPPVAEAAATAKPPEARRHFQYLRGYLPLTRPQEQPREIFERRQGRAPATVHTYNLSYKYAQIYKFIHENRLPSSDKKEAGFKNLPQFKMDKQPKPAGSSSKTQQAAESAINSLTVENAQLRKSLRDAENSRKTLLEMNDSIKAHVEWVQTEYKNRKSSDQRIMERMHAEIANLRQQLSVQPPPQHAYLAKIKAQNFEIDTLKAELDELKKKEYENDEAKGKITKERYSKMNEEFGNLFRRLKEMNQKLGKNRDTSLTQATVFEDLIENFGKLNSEVDSLNQHLISASEWSQTYKVIDELNQRFDELQASKWNGELEEAKQQIEYYQKLSNDQAEALKNFELSHSLQKQLSEANEKAESAMEALRKRETLDSISRTLVMKRFKDDDDVDSDGKNSSLVL